jgi:hypothetical protein
VVVVAGAVVDVVAVVGGVVATVVLALEAAGLPEPLLPHAASRHSAAVRSAVRRMHAS